MIGVCCFDPSFGYIGYSSDPIFLLEPQTVFYVSSELKTTPIPAFSMSKFMALHEMPVLISFHAKPLEPEVKYLASQSSIREREPNTNTKVARYY